ncbi:MAG: hypothetical protein OXH69_07140 [Acidobacteria bacterium]|nr:hypothetical protein [Acidobacteriota bacterium]
MRIVAIVLIVVLLAPSGAAAGPILESAERVASRMVPAVAVAGQPVGCAQATANGADLADRREGSAGYLVGGIFIPVIMPLIGMASNPSAPAAEIRQVDDADLACFQDGYRDRGRSKKVRSGWIGSGIGIGMFVLLVAAAAAETTYYRY